MRLVRDLIRANRASVLLLALLSLASGALSAALIALMTYSARQEDSVYRLGSLAPLFVAASAALLLARHGHRYLVTAAVGRIENDLRLQLARIVLSCSARRLEDRGAHGLLAILVHDVDAISGLVLSLPNILSNAVLVLGALLYLGFLSGWLLLVSVLMLSAGAGLSARIALANLALFEDTRDQYTRLIGYYNGLARGFKELKLDERAGEALLHDHVGPATEALAAANLQTVRRHSAGQSVSQGAVLVLLAVVVFLFPLWGAPPHVVLTYVVAVSFLMGPVEAIVNSYPLFANARVALGRIADLARELAGAEEAKTTLEASQALGDFCEVGFVGVQFRYSQNDPPKGRFGPVSLSIRRGEVVFFAGANGAGKTTLVKLLCGLYEPTAGAITWNGREVTASMLQPYRQRWSVVFSDFHLFGNALSLYDLEAARESLVAAELGLGEVLRAKGDIEELSAGQRRRLALLMSVVSAREIHVFDEPGAELDPESRRFFYQEVIPLLRSRGKTVVVVSHDDRYFACADRVVTLRGGLVVSDSACGGAQASG